MKFLRNSCRLAAGIALTSTFAEANSALQILSNHPAKTWENEATPVGNSRIGAMVFGDPAHEKIQFNEISLWLGGKNESGGYEEQGADNFGAYQNFGEVLFDAATPGEVKNYSRVLDLNTTVVTTTWQESGVTFKREVFASRPDNAVVIRFSADKPGKISGVFRLKSAQKAVTKSADGALVFADAMSSNLRYAAELRGISLGGKLAVEGDTLKADACNRITIVLAAHTDFALDHTKNFRTGEDPALKASAVTKAVLKKDFDAMQKAHVADFQKLFGRVAVDFGKKDEAIDKKPLAERLAAYKKGGEDLGLEELLFQYGRYLIISSSRDSLPANLQGLWNDNNSPAWRCDYHTNINLQMNYWLVDPANLSECAAPLFAWIKESIPRSREATQKQWGKDTPGWTMRTSVNSHGGNGWDWNVPASAWLSRHYFEHYAYTLDRGFLEKEVWPILREVSEFQLSELTEKDGKLLVKHGWSPEHGPREDGVSHDQQIAWDLFSNLLISAKALDKMNDPVVVKVREAREKLLGPKVGSWGQIMEWTTERPDLEKSGHRHTSHLYAVYPGNQINAVDTPDLLKGAEVSLLKRGSDGDSRRSWTWAWRSGLWARMGKGEKVGEMVRGLLAYNTLDNLFTTHPPFQIDGNLGITAGMCEALLQSQAGECVLLPALPKKWESGKFTGICARGGFVFDAKWDQSKVKNLQVHSKMGSILTLRLPGNPPQISAQQVGNPKILVMKPNAKGAFVLPTKAGGVYKISL